MDIDRYMARPLSTGLRGRRRGGGGGGGGQRGVAAEADLLLALADVGGARVQAVIADGHAPGGGDTLGEGGAREGRRGEHGALVCLLVGAVAHLVLGRLHVRVVLDARKRVVRRLVLRLRLRPAAARVVLAGAGLGGRAAAAARLAQQLALLPRRERGRGGGGRGGGLLHEVGRLARRGRLGARRLGVAPLVRRGGGLG